MTTIYFQKLDPEARVPEKASDEAAGFDLRALNRYIIRPGERQLVPTGIAIALPPGFEGQIRSRSGLALKHGVTVLNAPGTIDADYCGEIGVILINHDLNALYVVDRGDRIAQLVIAPILKEATFDEVIKLVQTNRGSGGFGSTGV